MTSKVLVRESCTVKNSGVKKSWIKPQKTELVAIVKSTCRFW